MNKVLKKASTALKMKKNEIFSWIIISFFGCLLISTSMHICSKSHSVFMSAVFPVHFHFPLPEMYKEQTEIIRLTQIDGGQDLHRLDLFKSTDLWLLKKNADIIRR